MSRRSVNPSRRVSDGGLPSVGGLFHHKSRSPPVLTIALVVLVYIASMFCCKDANVAVGICFDADGLVCLCL